MNLSEWSVQIAQPEDDVNSRTIAYSLYSFFSVLPFREVTYSDLDELDLFPATSRNLIVIHSGADSAIRLFFKSLFICAYGNKKQSIDFLNRYLFIDLGGGSVLFEGIRRPLEHCHIAKTAKIWTLMPTIVELLVNTPEGSYQCDLQSAIETTSFPSGASEMLETYFRKETPLHKIFGRLRGRYDEDDSEISTLQSRKEDKRIPALRMLIGAFCAGEVEFEKMTELLKGYGLHEGDGDIFNQLETIYREVLELKIEVNASNITTLSSYLNKRRLLIIEDQLSEQCWDEIFPVLIGGIGKISPDNHEGQSFNGTLIDHNSSIKGLLQQEIKFQKYDVILLDLYSSKDNVFNTKGQHRSDVPHSIKKFFDKLDEEYKETLKQDIVKVTFPTVVVFSADHTGITARTMFRDFGASDYFFKISETEAYKSGYFSAFKNTLISAIEDNTKNILSLPAERGRGAFDIWLDQFLPVHRPDVLTIMKHFRFYSSTSIIRAFDEYLKNHANFKLKDPSDSGKGYISLFDEEYLNPINYVLCGLGRANKSGPASLALLSKTKWIKELHNKSELANHERAHAQPASTSYEFLWEKISKHFNSKPDEKLVVVFVDDFIGSGGQVKTYVEKFVKNVSMHILQEYEDRKKKKNRKKNKDREKENSVFNLTPKYKSKIRSLILDYISKIEIHVLFAVGLINEHLKKEEFKIKPIGTRHTMTVKMTADIVIKKKEWTDQITYKKLFKIHIADAVLVLKDICEQENIDYSHINGVLSHYVLITQARKKERPCQFEPLGWKNCGGMVSLYSNAPGNTLPIIWADGVDDNKLRDWVPLFPRFFNPWDDGKFEKPEDWENCEGDPYRCELLGNLNKDFWPNEKRLSVRVVGDTEGISGESDLTRSQPCWIK